MLCASKSVFANGAGLPPFFEINGKLANTNPLAAFGINASAFLLPQDIAPEKYLVNTPIDFKVNEEDLTTVIPEEIMDKTQFDWDFGDGTKADGTSQTHTYKKPGSYFLVVTIKVYAEDSEIPTQFVDSFLITVLPNKDFKNLPQAVLKVNGRVVEQNKNPINNRIDDNLNKNVSFDASQSRAPGSKIVEYFWDFGDGTTASGPRVTHNFNGDYFDTIVLRVKDKNGFISDAFVNIRNTKAGEKQSVSFTPFIIGGVALVAIIFAAGLVIFIKRKS